MRSILAKPADMKQDHFLSSVTMNDDGNRLFIRGECLTREAITPYHSGNYESLSEFIDRIDKPMILDFDCAGGEVAGLTDIARKIYNKRDLLTAEITGICTSAAYYLASACKKILAKGDCIVGSIGTMMFYPENKGMWVSNLSKRKNASDEQITDLLDYDTERFLRDVASFRNWQMNDVLEISMKCGQGKVFNADEALKAGLIDEIVPFERGEDMFKKKAEEMIEETVNEEEVTEQMDEESTEAKIDRLEQRIRELEAENTDLKAKLDELTKDPSEEEVKEEEIKEEIVDKSARAQIKKLSLQLMEKEGKIMASEMKMASRLYDLDQSLFNEMYGSRKSANEVTKPVSSRVNVIDDNKSLNEKALSYVKSHPEMSYIDALKVVLKGDK